MLNKSIRPTKEDAIGIQKIIEGDIRVEKSPSEALFYTYKDAAENAKIELSSNLETTISLPFIGMSANGPISFEKVLTRANFEDMTRHLLDRCRIPLEKAFADAKLNLNAS